MVVKTQKANANTTNYSFTRKAGRSIIEHRPVFSPDGESLVIIVEKIARVYNIKTGDCVRVLEAESNIDDLVGICFDKDGFNVYGCSEDGYLITWTWEKGAVLREFKLPDIRNRKVCTFDLIDNERCFITSVESENKRIFLSTYSLKPIGPQVLVYTGPQIVFYGFVRVALGWCNGERYAAIINGTKFIYIQNLEKPHIHAFHSNYNEFRVLDVAAHHSESALAIVDTLGRATIIRGDLLRYKSVAREVLHWHFLPPFAVKFSTEGSYLITGGMEKVLLKWTIGNLAHKANQKEFIPRLPGIIKFIAVSASHIAVTLSNNSVVIASAQMRVLCTILECGGLSPAARAVGSSLVYHRNSGCLLMGGRPGHLQLYSTSSDKVLYNLDVTEMNSIPSESKHNLIPLETEVTCAAISGNGNWLVTSEYRDDGVTYPEERLKFWASQPSKMAVPFALVSCVNLSHGGCYVVAITLNTIGSICVTAGMDHKFRIWQREKNSSKNKSYWTCLTACYYSSGVAQFQSNSIFNDIKKFEVSTLVNNLEVLPYMKEVGREGDLILRIMNVHKDSGLGNAVKLESRDPENEMGGVAVSQDGSLIAAWFGCKLTLWDTHLCNLRTTLSHHALRPKGIHVQFGIGDAAHYLVCTTENCVAVFSLLSLTVKWLVPIRPTCLVADPYSNKMAVVTTQNDVFVFTPHSSTPILKQNRLLNPSNGVINICTFAKSTKKDDIRLYLMTNNSEIYCLEPEQSTEDRLEVISHKNVPTSNFGALLAEQQLSEVQPMQAAELHAINSDALGQGAFRQFLSAAPHMVPPVSLISTAFLEQLSGQEISAEPEEENGIETMEVDPQSSDDEAEVHGPREPNTQLWTPNYDQIKEKRLKKIVKVPTLREDATASIFGLKCK